MPDPQPSSSQSKSQQNKHQSMHLNRLIQFIETKKSSSTQKLKEILLSKDCPLNKQPTLSQRPTQNKKIQKTERENVTLNTKNIFVARNKTESSSPRVPEDFQNKYYKIFITKQEILKLHSKQRSQYLPSGVKQKFNFNLITNPEQRHKSNLFPPLAVPKLKRPVIFNKFEDQTSKWLNTEIRNLQQALNSTSGDPLSEELSALAQKQTQKHQQVQLHREKYNKSLQKLIEKAFKIKQKPTSPQKINSMIEGIQGYDSKLVIHGETYDSQQNRNQSVYASKGKLLSNPNLKIKKDTRFKSEKRQAPDKLTITIDHQQLPLTEAQLKKIFDAQYKRRIIHTNREAIYVQSALKLKTQISAKPADCLPSSIRSRSHKKALKLISELESSIIKTHQESIKSSKKIKLNQLASKTINQNDFQNTDKHTQESAQKNQSQKIRRKREQRKIKTKTLFGNSDLPELSRTPVAKWQLAGYDWRQSTDEIQQNIELEKYVSKIVKKSDPIPLNQTLKKTQ